MFTVVYASTKCTLIRNQKTIDNFSAETNFPPRTINIIIVSRIYRYPFIGFNLHGVSDPLEFRSRTTVRITFQRDRIAFPYQHVRQQFCKLWRNHRAIVFRVRHLDTKINVKMCSGEIGKSMRDAFSNQLSYFMIFN